ncbi:1-acyl-sn-glycerol-3-phosphate acyltransferase [Sediminibacterium sp. TEGAF015]|uniref:1-acyl-sn-glycerol-3-phosphate acyltransferase n=1 Tax=Sediminibacterium sp. TEGAF015 TaxID=575378 RepID=UPI0021FA733B|nr:1-acyl-sn-glycerol-3-phosphate acyltransferase [Sediminibacterium sp. TEGAF015]BDQ12866.1 acyltransferase [Sediminibacterium sp. TEGAF015]
MRICWNLFLQMQGWKIRNEFPYHLKKCVIAVGPHTSAWDFVIGLAVRSKLKLYHLNFLGKAELFKGRFGFFFRKMGGYPVDRFSNNNVVDQVAEQFKIRDQFVLALSPEGTRKKVDKLRTGFYHIALKAGVPIVLAGLDFGRKEISFSEPILPTGNMEEDFKKIIHFFADKEGKIPEYGLKHLDH